MYIAQFYSFENFTLMHKEIRQLQTEMQELKARDMGGGINRTLELHPS